MKIGIYSFPDVDPERAIGYAKTIYSFPNHRMTKEAFASKNNIKVKAGWFGQVTLAMRTYGFVDENGDGFVATELMEKLLYPKPGTSELQDAKLKVFNSVPLWKKLYGDGIDKTYSEKDDFWVYLCDLDGIKGLDREIVKKKAPFVKKGYISALAYVADVRAPISSPSPKPKNATQIEIEQKTMGSDRSEKQIQSNNNEGKEQLKIQQGGLYIEILQDDKALDNIEYAKDLLSCVEKRLRSKMQQN